MEGVPESNLLRLSRQCGRDWKAVRSARHEANAVCESIAGILHDDFGRISSSDADLVVFGSLARGEWTVGSDVDWTLLVDGQATPEHRRIAQAISRRMGEAQYNGRELRPPGGTGIFGNLAFSHDIIHHIGGQNDTNKNTTQRILLLLESKPLRAEESEAGIGAHERVVRGILDRYLHDDTNFIAADKPPLPRFLLNDIVRFWRTMCVDFACKEWEQEGSKWALRNVKLRMSRKMIFVSGLLIVFSSADFSGPSAADSGAVDGCGSVRDQLAKSVLLTPLELLARELMRLSLVEQARSLFDLYDEFLARMNEEETRARLEQLPPKEVYSDPMFLELRKLSHAFQDVLNDIFFDAETPLREFTRSYGVF